MRQDRILKPIDEDTVNRFVAKYYPHLLGNSLKYHGGASFSVYSVESSDLIFRFSKSDWENRLDELKATYERENSVINKIYKHVLPHQLPVNVNLVIDGEIFCGAVWILKRFNGDLVSDFLADPSKTDRVKQVAYLLGDFLGKVHSININMLEGDIEVRHVSRSEVIEKWFENFEDNKMNNFPLLSEDEKDYVEEVYSRFLAMAQDMEPMQCICHGDFEPDNCFISNDKSHLEIIDIEDLTYGQAVGDFCSWYGYYGENFVRTMLDSYKLEVDKLFMERVRFYYQRIPLFYFTLAREYHNDKFMEYGRERLRSDMKRFM